LSEDLFVHPILLHYFQVAQPTYPLPLYPFYYISPLLNSSGRGVDHASKFSAGVKERVELYLKPFSAPLWHIIQWTLPLRRIHT
jgi:hypothetical protein